MPRADGLPPTMGTMSVVVEPISISSASDIRRATSVALARKFVEAALMRIGMRFLDIAKSARTHPDAHGRRQHRRQTIEDRRDATAPVREQLAQLPRHGCGVRCRRGRRAAPPPQMPHRAGRGRATAGRRPASRRWCAVLGQRHFEVRAADVVAGRDGHKARLRAALSSASITSRAVLHEGRAEASEAMESSRSSTCGMGWRWRRCAGSAPTIVRW